MTAPHIPPLIGVAAAVMIRGDGQVLLAQRPPGKAYAGYWEFPGGKIEPGETPHDALLRELREELGVEHHQCIALAAPAFCLSRTRTSNCIFSGSSPGPESSPAMTDKRLRGSVPGALTLAPLLPANATVLRALELPPVYAITNAADGETGNEEDAFLERLQRALEGWACASSPSAKRPGRSNVATRLRAVCWRWRMRPVRAFF